jgi:hypothetical protein
VQVGLVLCMRSGGGGGTVQQKGGGPLECCHAGNPGVIEYKHAVYKRGLVLEGTTSCKGMRWWWVLRNTVALSSALAQSPGALSRCSELCPYYLCFNCRSHLGLSHMPCYAVPCCDIPCFAALCHAVLCRWTVVRLRCSTPTGCSTTTAGDPSR